MCLTILVFLINVFMVLVMGIIDHVPAALDVLAAALGPLAAALGQESVLT